MSTSSIVDEVVVNYSPVDINEEPDFSQARITGVILNPDDEIKMRIKVGQVIEAGNNLAGYSRKELSLLCDVKSAQFSKIVKGEAWLNLGNLGLWGFATGITPSDVVKLAPLNSPPAVYISWFINGHLNHIGHDEFDLFTQLLCRRFGLRHVAVNVSGDEPLPKLRDKQWQQMYLDDMYQVVRIRIRQLREVLGLTQKSFADVLGVTADTIKRYEEGSHRYNRGVYSTYRLYLTTNLRPIELTKGSIHHKLRYVQEQRHEALMAIVQQLDYQHYKTLKSLALALSRI